MTAYLQPGDKIHIAVPVSSPLRHVAETEVRDTLRTLEEAYGKQGVTIMTISGGTDTTHPVVVAVIREPITWPPMAAIPEDRS